MTDLAYARGEEGDQALSNAARYSRVTPWVISLDSNAEIAFLAATFGAVETPGSRFQLPDGRIERGSGAR